MFGPQFDPNQLKVQLKLAVSRIQILKNKKANLVRDEKRHIAELLRNHNEESARIRVETVIRDENLIECYSIIEIPELELIKKQLLAKYGRGLEHEVNCHCATHVNPKIVHKLSYITPEPFMVFQVLNDIACQFKIDWSVDCPIVPPAQPQMVPQMVPQMMNMQQPQMQQQPQMHPQMQPAYQQQPPQHHQPPAFPTLIAPQHYTPPSAPQFPSAPSSSNNSNYGSMPPAYTPTPIQFPSPPTQPMQQQPPSSVQFTKQQPSSMQPPPPAYTPTTYDGGDQYPDFDELTARFEALKRQNEVN
eukprot:gene2449-2785_t